MKITYRDELGYVEITLTKNSWVIFDGGFVFFTDDNEINHTIACEDVHSVSALN